MILVSVLAHVYENKIWLKIHIHNPVMTTMNKHYRCNDKLKQHYKLGSLNFDFSLLPY